jgi:hypothetical protein
MSSHTPQTLLNSLREEPNTPGVLENTIDALVANRTVDEPTKEGLRAAKVQLRNAATARESVRAGIISSIQTYLVMILEEMLGPPLRRSLAVEIPPQPDFWSENFDLQGGRRRKSQTKRFGSCVKAVRKTVKARKGSSAESAAIAICTTTILHPRGRTIKRYRKGRLLTQKRK